METQLNEVQQKIVNHTEGAVMVLAGAGSGKTRVLTHRIAHIIKSGLASPYEVLAITFTNKAANEIKQRLFDMGLPSLSIWAMTFHSMCCRILRSEASHLSGYTTNFSIYDEQDKKNTIKKILKENNLKDDDYLADVCDRLSQYKISNITLDEYKKTCCFSQHDNMCFEIMQKYEERLQQNNSMDFDDLINKTLMLLKNDEYVRDKYQHQFRYILVDEFQDTNETQYNLVKILGAYHQNVFAVGDEDQSIYSWRGASIDNIKRFLKDFSGATLYKLEQNYRSTKTIIASANKIIKNNQNRIDKTLFTENETGSMVVYNKCYTDREEAEFVVKTISGLVASGKYNYSDIAILMRLNALSRNFEEKLMNYNVPYKMFGGQKFYERAEIKNVMAYLKLIVNPRDDESFYRIVNLPKRGIGDGAIQKLRETCFGASLLDGVLMLPNSTVGALSKFVPFKALIQDLKSKQNELELYDYVNYVVEKSGILSAYATDSEEDYNRKLNISEFLQNVKQFAHENQNKTLADFLQTVSLTADIDSYEEDNNNVVLATVHSVKGLEFKVVFIVGLEEKYFPISRMNSTDEDMEEERRLMYVAVTRAKEKLFLTCSKSRYMYGKQNFSVVSRFVKELGYENKTYTQDAESTSQPEKEQRPKLFGSISSFMHKVSETKKQSAGEYMIGDRVSHAKFGVGYIVKIDASTNSVSINFDNFGQKTLCLDFAPIKKI
jgi:DNA helicase-2/ATP-dependent DNA helicase PcrA